jgi:hypothetical protein
VSFEKDYERGIRDKVFGRSIRQFGKGAAPEEVCRDISKAICENLREMHRSGSLESIFSIIEIYLDEYTPKSGSGQTQLLNFPEPMSAIASKFLAACDPVLRTEERSVAVETICVLAEAALYESHDKSTTVRLDRGQAGQALMQRFLESQIRIRMQPAMPIAAQKCAVGPDAIDELLNKAISLAQLDKIAQDTMSRKGEKLRAPNFRSHGDKICPDTSLLPACERQKAANVRA